MNLQEKWVIFCLLFSVYAVQFFEIWSDIEITQNVFDWLRGYSNWSVNFSTMKFLRVNTIAASCWTADKTALSYIWSLLANILNLLQTNQFGQCIAFSSRQEIITKRALFVGNEIILHFKSRWQTKEMQHFNISKLFFFQSHDSTK